MWPHSDAAQKALSGSHTIAVKLVVDSPGAGVSYPPVFGGSIDVDTGSQARRSGTITTNPLLWPKGPTESLVPFGTTVRPYRGVYIPGQAEPEWFPLGLFYLEETSRQRTGTSVSELSLKLVDPAQRVSEDLFESPTQTIAGATCVAEITRLIRGTLGSGWPVIDLTGSTLVAPVLDIETDRWGDGIEKLADAIAAEVFFDQAGQAVIRPQPTLQDPAVWSARTGPGGNLLRTDERWTRENVINRWIVTGQRSDGSDPVRAVVSDDDPNSPTWVGGPFGKKVGTYSTPLATTEADCAAIGAARLARTTGVACVVDFDLIVHPGLDGGDVVTLKDADLGEAPHIVDSLSIPLTATDSMSVKTRASFVGKD